MGRDKSRVRLGRRALLTHVRAAAASLALPTRIIRHDIVPRCGPLGGIYTALASSGAEVELFLACDSPFVSTALLRRLLRSLRPVDLACFTTVDGLAGFPLAIRSGCVDIVAREIRRKRWSLQQLAGTLRGRTLAPSSRDRRLLFNINTDADLEAARRLAGRESERRPGLKRTASRGATSSPHAASPSPSLRR